MTILSLPQRSHSSTASSGSDDWDLPPAETTAELPPDPITEEPDRTPDQKICPTCDKPIYREPGTRGRLPKYHPECKPSGRSASVPRTPRGPGANKKAEAEATAIVDGFKKQIVKVVFLMGATPALRYEAFCVMTCLPEITKHMHAVLVNYDSLRNDLKRISSGGSIAGLVFSLVTMLLPIVAYRGWLPVPGQVAKVLVQVPIVMSKMAKREKEGEQAVADMMERGADEMLRLFMQQNQAKPEQPENVDGSAGH